MRRTVPALIVIAALAGAALAGCSASSESAASCTVTSGSSSDSITASGKFGQDPKAKVPSPLNAPRVESSTLIKGTGPRVSKGGAAKLALTLFDGQTGAGTQTEANVYPVVASKLSAGLTDALACSTVGSRIAVVLPAKEASTLGASGPVVVIADIEKAVPSHATGRPVPATPGFPTVILGAGGQPGIVIGDHAAPKKVSSAILKQGDGGTAKKSDTLIVQTQTVEWSDPTSASGSWEQGSPATQTLSDGTALSSQLIGKKIGSQVIVQLPASKNDGEAAVTVVDLLGILPASSASAQ